MPPFVRSVLVHGQPAWQMALPAGDQVVVAEQGGQVLSWTTADGAERFFLSPRSVFDGHSAVRGGVPVCFPQFNQRGSLPKHGFARNLPWRLEGGEEGEQGATLRLILEDSEATRRWWPEHAFAARLAVTLGAGTLRLELSVHNPGPTAWDFTAALHGYLRVDDIGAPRLEGLDGQARAFERQTDFATGGRRWTVLAEGAEPEVDAVLRRGRARDPDLWLIEIEDRQGRTLLDEPGLSGD